MVRQPTRKCACKPRASKANGPNVTAMIAKLGVPVNRKIDPEKAEAALKYLNGNVAEPLRKTHLKEYRINHTETHTYDELLALMEPEKRAIVTDAVKLLVSSNFSKIALRSTRNTLQACLNTFVIVVEHLKVYYVCWTQKCSGFKVMGSITEQDFETLTATIPEIRARIRQPATRKLGARAPQQRVALARPARASAPKKAEEQEEAEPARPAATKKAKVARAVKVAPTSAQLRTPAALCRTPRSARSSATPSTASPKPTTAERRVTRSSVVRPLLLDAPTSEPESTSQPSVAVPTGMSADPLEPTDIRTMSPDVNFNPMSVFEAADQRAIAQCLFGCGSSGYSLALAGGASSSSTSSEQECEFPSLPIDIVNAVEGIMGGVGEEHEDLEVDTEWFALNLGGEEGDMVE